jgi:ribosome-binding protein aMBF1 (putative translation factor)
MTALRTTRALLTQRVHTRHQLAQGDVQAVSQFEELEKGWVRLSARYGVDLVQAQASAVIGDGGLRHVLIFSDQDFDGLRERGLILATWFRLPLRWHERKPALSSRRGVSQYIGYHRCRQPSTAHFAMTSLSHQTQLLSLLGRSIRALREEKGLDSKQLAAKAGVRHWRVTATEEGRLDIDYESLVKLADALDVGVATIVERAKRFKDEGASHE